MDVCYFIDFYFDPRPQEHPPAILLWTECTHRVKRTENHRIQLPRETKDV